MKSETSAMPCCWDSRPGMRSKAKKGTGKLIYSISHRQQSFCAQDVCLICLQARISVCGYLAVAAVLSVISADRFYNLAHFHVSKAYYASSRGTFAGLIIAAVADFAMLYMAGVPPAAT